MNHSDFYKELVKDSTLMEFLQYTRSPNLSLIEAFNWQLSPSGIDYWINLHSTLDAILSPYDLEVIKDQYPEYFI